MVSDGGGTRRGRGGLEGPFREDRVVIAAVVVAVELGVEEAVPAAEEVEGAEDEDDATGLRRSTGMRRACFARADK